MLHNFEYHNKRIQFEGKEIQTYSFGDGKNVIFAFPSYPHSGLYYIFFTQFYPRNNYRFITFDLPGWAGWSANIFDEGSEEPIIPKLLDIAKLVLAEYKVDKFSLLGYSFGAALAFMLAAQNPDRINKLVLVSPLIFGQYTFGTSERMQLALAQRLRAHHVLKSLFIYKTRQQFPRLRQYIQPELLNLYASMFAQADSKVLLKSIWELFNMDNEDLLPQIQQIKDIMIVSSVNEEKLFRYQAEHLRRNLDKERTLKTHGSHDDFILHPTSETVAQVMDFLTR